MDPTGKDEIVHLIVGGEDLKAIIEGETDVTSGEIRQMMFRPEPIHLFGAESGCCVY